MQDLIALAALSGRPYVGIKISNVFILNLSILSWPVNIENDLPN